MPLSSLRELARSADIRFDRLTRQLFATDASIYQIEPEAVAFPRSPADTAQLIHAAAADGVEVIPRGAGTGLAGGAIGPGLVIDYSRYNRAIDRFDRERRTVYVQAGVVLDQLNAFLRSHGLRFGPDVATSSRATLGGMIANNSSGSHVPYFGTTMDHVRSIDVVLADGREATIGPETGPLADLHAGVAERIDAHHSEIEARMPVGLLKRWPGYGVEDWIRGRPGLVSVMGGSEGTLAVITGAELSLSPVPARKGVAAIFFSSVAEAMQASVELLDLNPAAIEHVDRLLFDQTRGQLAFRRARTLLELDETACKSILLVEFFDDVTGPLDAVMSRRLGLRSRRFTDASEMEAIWALRKAGLSLLTGCVGARKPVAGIEDACVPVRHLPEYVAGLQSMLGALGLEASFYGHAASGLLHVRPAIDLHSAEDLAKFRRVGDEVAALVKQYKGSIAGEHGVGIARTEWLEDQLGPDVARLMREIKGLFDPRNLLNPGKVVADGRYRFDTNLRWGAGYEMTTPFEPQLAYAFKDGSFAGNLEQCNGCGGCRKDAPTMCPTYLATGEEIMSTRGRANTIRAVLDGRLREGDGFWQPELDEALDYCLSCKACTTECPSNVNLALLKAELLNARHSAKGLPLRERVLSRVDAIGALGAAMPRLANAVTASRPVRRMMERTLGLAAERPLPKFAARRFDRLFARRKRSGGARGRAVLWDDCFTRYYEPEIGDAAVRVMEVAGYEVRLPRGRVCCGRPAFSLGRLDLARAWAQHNARVLAESGDSPVVFLEPSCFSMVYDDYRELSIEGADALHQRARLFESFMVDALRDAPDALRLRRMDGRVAVHAHCHAKSLVEGSVHAELLAHVPGCEAQVLNTACCGMAGAFGAMTEKYALSMTLGRMLAEKIAPLPRDARVVASGTSCRHQIEHVTDREPLHMAELLAAALEPAE